MEVTIVRAVPDRLRRKPKVQQLSAGDDAVLAGRELSDDRVGWAV